MNVLHLIGSFEQGGSEAQALQLARLQREDGSNVHLACFHRRGPLLKVAEAITASDIPQFPIKGFYYPDTAIQLNRLARDLRRRRIDVIHTHDFYTNVFGLTAGALAGVRARVGSRRETFGFRSPSQKFVERLAYRLAHVVIANSKAVKEQLVREGVTEDKIAVVYNGLDLVRVTPAATLERSEVINRLGLQGAETRRLVTLVANMRHPVKDQPTFLRAAERVLQSVPDAGFVLAGEGELADQIRNLARTMGLEDSVYFPGRCESIADLLHISEVCVLSSQAEGFSNSILEYMAAGRPVVATDVGGAREAVSEGEDGYLVPAGDDDKMAQRITTLLQDSSKAHAMGARGRQVVLDRFSCETQLRACEAVYEKALAARLGSSTRVIKPEERRTDSSA